MSDPSYKELASRVASLYLSKTASPSALYHTTGVQAVRWILFEGAVQGKHQGFVSFSEVPLIKHTHSFGDVSIQFSGRLSSQLTQVQYTKRWLYYNPYIAAYIVGPGNDPDDWDTPEDMITDVLNSNYAYQKEWVGKDRIKFKPTDVVAILVRNESIADKVRNTLPVGFEQVPIRIV